MATTTTTSGGTTTSFSNTPQAQDDIFTTGVIGTSSAAITEDLLGVVYLDVMSNDLGGSAKTLWSLDNATSLSTATKVYAPADLLLQDTSRVEATSSDTSFNGAKIWITSDGKVGYDAATLSTAFKAQLQALAAGTSLTDSFTYAIRLGNGTLSWATAQVQFAGANDSVTMSLGAQTGTVTEDAATTASPTDPHSATGTIAFNDVDLSDTHTASFVAAPGNATALGNFALASVIEAANAANGTVNWTYTLNNAAAQSLAQGQTASETYVVTVSDGHGSSTTQNVTITITGTNDQVQITSGVQTGDAKEDSGDYAASGNITFTDADLIDTHSVTVTPGASGYLGSFTTDPLNDSTGTGSGSLGWHFAVDNAALQFLGEGQIVTQTYNVAIGDGAVQTVTITITGTNDRPTLTIADTTGAMSEGNAAATLSDSGALSFADLDNIDAVTVSHTANGNIAWSGGTLDAGVASALVAGFSVDQNSWDYSSSQNLDFLGAGETITFSYRVVATDNSGAANAASATQTVSITITGSNDAPVLSFTTGNDAGAAQEDTTLSVSGQFSSTDIDHAATATWSIAGSNTGTYGSIAVDSTGQWTYTLANSTDGVASAVQSLKAGESHDEVFSVRVSDGLGGVDTQLVTVTVTGSNDAPVLSFATGNDLGAVQEDTTLSVSGQFSSTDIDHAATATWSIAGSNTGTYGSIAVDGTGQWTYTLANGTDGVASAVQSLKAGESHDEVFSVRVSDGLGGVDTQLVTVTVTGSNDAPVLSFAPGNDAGAVKEDTTLSVSGQFSSADIDHDATATWTINGSPTGTYGSIAVDGTGQWTYTLANGTDGVASAVQSLKAGESHDEVFSVQVSDGLGGVDTQLVTVTVTGSNDAPVLSFAPGNDLGAVQEDSTLSVSGQFSSTDIDHAATATWSIVGANTGSYGSIIVDGTGQWTYTLANGTDGVASAVQSLKAGESHDEVFSVQVSDGLGGVDTQLVTVTVTGSNDAPVLSFAPGNDLGAVQEDSTLSVSGQFSSTDIDHAATATWSIVGANTGSYGSIIVDGTGQWTYTLANSTDGVASAVQSLKAGESHNEVFSVQVSDGLGGVDTQLVTVTVTGSNDAPVISFASGGDAGAVKEDTTLSVSGQFNSTDIDHDATATWSIVGANTGSFGSIAVDSNGQWTYTLANGTDGVASAVQSLKAGESHDEVFSVQVSDGLGGVDTQLVTVTVTGSNDQPTLTIADTSGAMNEGNGTATLSDSGALSFADLDSTDAVTVSHTANGDIAWSGGTLNAGMASALVAGFSVDQNSWDYSSNQNLDFLGSGETITFSYTVVATDDSGAANAASATQTVTITLTGTNDQPTLTIADTTGTMNEGNGTATLSDSGALSFADLDSTDAVTVSHTANGDIAWSGGTLNAGVASALVAGFSVDQNSWDYSSNQNLDFLGSGETITFSYTVVATDDSGAANAASATQTVSITITGSNDTPMISFASGNDVGAVQEDSTLSVSGQFSSADIDHDATATWTINGSPTGTYGSIAVDSTGQWTYTLANGTDGVASAVQSLKAGESHDEVFSVRVSDGLGGVDTQLVTVTVTGSNDAPVLSFATGNDLGAVQEDTTLSVSGQFSSADIDHAATATWSIAGSNTGTYGSIAVDGTGQWTYTLANGTDGVASAVQSLKAGESHNEVFSVQVSDGLGGVDTQLVTVTITGSNDAPVLSFATGNDLGAVQEDTTLSVSGQFSSTDIDHDATATWSIAGSNTGSYGSIAVDSTGQWTYTLANGSDGVASAVQSLKAGESHDEMFSVQVSDGLGGVDTQLVTITVTGTNDAAVLSSASVTLSETNAPLTTGGYLTVSDIDSPENFQAQTNTAGNYGTFSIGTGGAWTYVADSAHNEFVAGTTYTDTFAVSSADGTLTSVTVHILGTNDAAVLSTGIANLTETNAAVDISTAGSLTISDVDSAATFVAQTNTAGSYGKFSIGTGGAWTYTADSAHNEFAAGTTYTDTFTVSSADGTLTSVTVHILGTNDAAVLSAGIANLTETNAATDISTAGSLTISDVDSAATFIAQTNTAGNYGKFSISTGGAWTYTADSAHNEFAAGTTYTDTFAVSSADGTLTSVTVHIAGSNDSPTITSNGGGTTASINVTENTAAVTTVVATDVDLPAQTLSYSIVGGADAAKFSIVSGTGALSFIAAPNFETPTDSGTNNVYDVIVRASDGTLFDDQAIAVTVTGVNDNSPVITSNGGGATTSVNVAENTTVVTTVVATDADLPSQTLSYSILNTAGTDFGKFSISSSGVLTFNSAPDYENPQDIGGTGGDNAYVVDVQVADGNGGTDTQTLTVNVQNVVETPVDSVPPTVTVTGTALGSSIGSTSTVTFQFSETVSGFNLSDVSVTTTSGVPRGTFSNFTQVDGDTYTATLTRTQGGSLKVDVAANSYTDLAGNPGAAGSSANLPAGVAGEPINLALDIPLVEINGLVTVAISGVPSGWVFNAGTDNGDGTWTVQTNDPGALTVTSPGDFAGALVLDVNLYWSNSDGSSASAYVFNNVEVYAPGSPVFALSADDNLSGSSGADTFVFAQPIGNNQIYNFDVTADKIDLIGFTGVTAFADLSISNDANGNALVSIGSGQTVTLKGVDAADLSEANFQFDRDPLTSNSGTLTIADGAIMPFGGSIDNSGTIELGSAGNETRLEILFRGATLSGGGQVLLSDNAQNVIFGGSADTMLTNIDNRISGAGQLGAGQMILANAGLILASGLNSLVLDTGTHTITNSGVLESTGTGGMTVASTVENTGHLWANGGDLHLLADVTGNGSATIDGDASLTFAGAAHTSVAFHGEGAGSLVIAQAEAAGSLVGILGLESDDMLTFGNLAFGANTQLSYNANASGAGGLLTVDDGAHRAEVNLLGHYSAEDFQITDGGEAGTQVSYHGESSGTLVGSMLADTLSGGDGNDIIVGRGGEDTLSGGAGADVFAYLNANEGGDHILDYNYAEGDTVDLSALLNTNFVSGTSQVADFVQLAQSGSDITVQVDPDGANNGKHFVDVAVLDHTGTPGPDLVRTWFGEADHTLTA
ncbi:VCBS domain-containing protein [Pseudomonas chlororaphis]|uniref:VCBS domain-containing protein n=1 Tax=Pseudomonas chlororaphis TaxID=587753 RepID=UPI000F555143|nr:VCBS domain-containing protein [Pseudomonas chlororaphis]AZD46892.1 T1SS secreted agglutinin RTX [Pseudomonas chlororaphis subsp. aurantiaca]